MISRESLLQKNTILIRYNCAYSPGKLSSVHPVHSAIGSTTNGMKLGNDTRVYIIK